MHNRSFPGCAVFCCVKKCFWRCGGFGLSAVQGARIRRSGQIIAIDTTEESLDLATRLGATYSINAQKQDPMGALERIAPEGVDHAFEAVGIPKTIKLSADIHARDGIAITIGMPKDNINIESPTATIVRREQLLKGMHCRSENSIDSFVIMIEYNTEVSLDLDSIVHFIKLSDINDLFVELENGTISRNMISFLW
ncbi:zinc-binding dehydrogenase [Mesorhizobium yinganensis]|uniref:zinc-binding dehydrogenase n=1 Tax=Mesorhizobium yinganensis TaxID=3157707 RepID=UPI0032B7AAA0